MRIKLACLALGAGLMALPASAQVYGDPCRAEQRANTGAGAVIGGIIGGVLGSQVAGRGHRSDGTAAGAVVGALVGGAAGNSTRDCTVTYGAPRPGYGYAPGGPYDRTRAAGRYGPGGYDRYGEAGYSQDQGSYSEEDRDRSRPFRNERDNSSGGRYDDRDLDGASRDNLPGGHHDDRTLDATSDDDYYGSNNDEFKECRQVDQKTRLPDGREVSKPVEACRSARYGEWIVRD